MSEIFKIKIGGTFEPLLNLKTDEMGIDDIYKRFKDKANQITKEVVVYKRHKQVDGLPQNIEVACKERREIRLKMLKHNDDQDIKEQYKTKNKEVKIAVIKHKKQQLEKKVEKMESDYQQNNSHNLFKIVREIEGKPRKTLNAVKDKQGVKHTIQEEVLIIWKEHFENHLNTEFPHDSKALEDIPEHEFENDLPLEISIEEIRFAMKKMKSRKSPGIDEITAEVLIAGGESMVRMLYLIFQKICADEQVPTDWKKMLVIPVYKKGDRLETENHRAIALLSIPGKVFSKILLDKMKVKTESAMSDRQYGFREGRGTMDAIFIVRQIIEKAKEHNVKIHFNFIDFKAAFDTIWRKALWKMMRSIGINSKIVTILEELYENSTCAVIISGQLTEWFNVNVGVRQGCLLSPVLFNIFLEFVMKELTNLDNEITISDSLTTDVRYADDTTLISTIFSKLQLVTEDLEEACKKWGMKINAGKCKIISPTDEQILIEGRSIEHVEQFTFLGSVVPYCTSDISRRIALASSAFGRLRENIWKRKYISANLKVRLYGALILPIATYAAETWTLKAEEIRRLEVFEMRCLRNILGITSRDGFFVFFFIT